MFAITSVAFGIWHLSYMTLAKGYTLPAAQIVLFVVNAAVMGAIWCMMRSISGSIVVSSVCHTLWNAGACVFFGEGPKPGAFGHDRHLRICAGNRVGRARSELLFLATLNLWSARNRRSRSKGRVTYGQSQIITASISS